MQLRVKTIGAGTHKDAFRVHIPTYELREHDPETGVSIIDIPEWAHPFTQEEMDAMSKTNHPEHGAIHSLTEDHLDKLHGYYGDVYIKPTIPYRLELV
jgi:hypothetical protein